MSRLKDMNMEQVIRWDKNYYLHNGSAASEYVPLVIDSVEGSYMIDSEGNRILDFMSGLVSVNMGQRNPKTVEAIKNALDRYGFLPDAYVTPYRAEASKLIIEDLLGPDKWAGKVRFFSTGSEAVEAALILAKLYTNRPFIVTRDFDYHGWTEGAGACTRLRRPRGMLVAPEGTQVRDVPCFPAGGYFSAIACDCYRCPLGNEYSECKKKEKLPCVSAMEGLIRNLGPENVAAVITEIIWGAYGGGPPPEYFQQLRKMTRELGVLWIDDEVITGFGRTGKWFAYQNYGVEPDIMTMGKGLVSSQLPASGVVVSKEIARFIDQYRWVLTATYAAHPVCMAAVAANIKVMIEEKIPERALEMGKYFGAKLEELELRHKCIGEVSGVGLLWGVEIVKNKETKEPFIKEDKYSVGVGRELSMWPSNIVMSRCMEKGVRIGGGVVPNTLRIAPSLTVTKEEIDIGVSALDYAFTKIDQMCG